ncbi:MAG: flavodoxin family protein [Actinomycetia bacterium]|nr:flavodoxin family protein [Actinomycetes bacterium]
MNVVLVEGSPRRGGNTASMGALLARRLRAGAAEVTRFSVAEQYFAPCEGCNACLTTGDCALRSGRDYMPGFYAALDSCDALLWVTPVYFAGLPAQLKALIDRFQVYYGRRLLRGKPVAPRRPAAAIIIGAGGDPFGAKAAVSILRSASQMAEFTLANPLVIFGPDAPGDIDDERFAEDRVAARLLVEALRERALSRA